MICAASCIATRTHQPPPPVPGTQRDDNIIEPWSSASEMGVSQDDKGSKIRYELVDGPKRGQRALMLEYNLKEGGWCGMWHTVQHIDLSKADSLRFMAKMDPPGIAQVDMTDANRVEFIAKFNVPSAEWTEVKVPILAFVKNQNYQPPDSIQGKPIDWSRTTGLFFDAMTPGPGKLWVGPVGSEKAPQ
jgi:hypothetical protein